MFKILTVREKVRVTPDKFGQPLEEAVKQSIQSQIEGKLKSDIGILLATTDIQNVSEGEILPEDGAVHYTAEFKILSYVPELNEIVIGEVVDTTEFGAFARIGPFDALIHVSQIMEDKVSYDAKGAVFAGRKTNKKVKKGDLVRARIVGISLGKSGRSKISLTMRQPQLGAIEWIEKEKKQVKK